MKILAYTLSIIGIALAMPSAQDIGRNDDSSVALRPPPETVSTIDLPNYLGRWYQMYASRIVLATYERDNTCVTADYGLNLDGSISVENSGRLKTPDGNLTQIQGFAYIPNPAYPGQLKVAFSIVPQPGDYWILKLGPKEESFPSVPQYQYAIVSTPLRGQLFVLARNIQQFNARFNEEVLAFLKEEGFTTYLNEPVKTLQNPECKYAGTNKQDTMKGIYYQNKKLF
ncbi:outer membrane lipoprotein Blc-like [Amphiura filiformis]|uniref:outer membrane lipoprotein Blc-like n=1 Tax=Amphiura filiformis TaxID=82378 RepID=UPI003B21B8D0